MKRDFDKATNGIIPKKSGNFERMETIAPNFYKIVCENGVFFISYDKVIVYINLGWCLKDNEGRTYLDYFYYDYSKTTMKHLCIALNEQSIKDIRKKIDNGDYILADFNNKLSKNE